MSDDAMRVGYVVKRYPRYSETFIVNEILAHETAGLDIEIFSLRAPEDTHFQDAISKVRATVTYLPDRIHKASEFWRIVQDASKICPQVWSYLNQACGVEVREVIHAVALAKAVRLRGIDHLHAHFATSATTVARLAAKMSRISYSFTAHAKDIFHETVEQRDLRQKFAEASSVVTVSDFNLNYLREHYGSATHRLHRIYNGLDLDVFPYRSPETRDRVIVAVGRLVEKKGFNVLIDACKILKQDSVAFRCQIIGAGTEEAALSDQIRRTDLEKWVTLIGSRPQKEVVEAVQSAAVMAAPCVVGKDGNRDGLPTVLLEAMALGTPCVSTDVTGIPEVVVDGQSGLMVQQHDPVSLAKALKQLLDNSELRVKLAGNARQLIEDQFDININASRIRELFRKQQFEAPKRAIGEH